MSKETIIAATVIKQAAEICDEVTSYKPSEWSSPSARPLSRDEIKERILALTPANAEAELELMIEKGVLSGIAWAKMTKTATAEELALECQRIVRRVLDEAKEESDG